MSHEVSETITLPSGRAVNVSGYTGETLRPAFGFESSEYSNSQTAASAAEARSNLFGGLTGAIENQPVQARRLGLAPAFAPETTGENLSAAYQHSGVQAPMGIAGLLAEKYPRRNVQASELEFFTHNRDVAGYAADDGNVVLSPLFKGRPAEADAVLMNERLRQAMKEHRATFGFPLLPHQEAFFRGTAYADDPAMAQQTIIARILSGDASGAPYSDEQMADAKKFYESLSNQNAATVKKAIGK